MTWNETKRQATIEKHGIDFAKIEDVFADPFALYFEDVEHSDGDETRLQVIGQANAYGLIVAVFVYIETGDVHIITARRAENWMVKEYEQNRK